MPASTAWLTFAAVVALLAAASAALWPRRPLLAALVWAGAPVALLAIFAHAPGPVPAIVGMPVVFWVLRAFDAARDPGRDGLGRAAFVRWVVDLSLIPARDERPPPPPVAIAWRAARALALAAVAIGLLAAGTRLELWRRSVYLDDLLFVVEAAVLFTAFSDVLMVGLWATGRPLPDLHLATFWRAPSLRVFWWRWNGGVSRVLGRAVLDPVLGREERGGGGGGRRTREARGRVAAGVLLVFLASGLVHALPLLVAAPDRVASLRLAAMAMAFFLVHGVVVVVEGTRVRRWLGPIGGRVLVWATFAVTAPLYPAAHGVALGLHGRTLELLAPW